MLSIFDDRNKFHTKSIISDNVDKPCKWEIFLLFHR